MKKRAINKHLEGISDLTLTAPIKQGFTDAVEAITYEGRLKVVMAALFRMRATAREYAAIRPFTDTAERIQSLRSFRIAVLDTEPQHRVALAATFDRAWEPYMRLIWKPLGAMLDVIFCNCDGYVDATGHSFDAYAQWVRDHQVDSDFFYATTGLSAADLQYLTQSERLYREGRGQNCDFDATGLTAFDPSRVSAEVRSACDSRLESDEIGLEALAALYRLVEFYPRDHPDGAYLLRAARDLLEGWDTKGLHPAARKRFATQLEWYEDTILPDPVRPAERLAYDPRNVQGGILTGYDQATQPGEAPAPLTHGCLMLMQVTDAAKARGFIDYLRPSIRTEADAERGPPADGIYCNLAFTLNGLENLGVPPEEIAAFPVEFRDGMEARAGLLGDVRANHPRRWRLPRRNWPDDKSWKAAAAAPIMTSEIDFVIQLRTRSGYKGHELVGAATHPLSARVKELAERAAPGATLLSVESMRRASLDPRTAKDHFGFEDGLSQPVVRPGPLPSWNDAIARGEILWGYANDRGDGPPPPSAYLDDGSFLVIRKLRQDVGELSRFLDRQTARIPGLTREDLLAKMMGRARDGTPLISGGSIASNRFDYRDDPKGLACPFQSHVRRANPRTIEHGRPTPRIVRRGLSYGPSRDDDPEAERGLFFMAYNASIAEQFEVIQRWVSGGNSTGVASCQSDPFMGTGQIGDPRTFRFYHDGKVVRVDLDETGPNPFVRLEWGLYLFAPSLQAIAKIAETPPVRSDAKRINRGQEIIDRLKKLPVEAAALGWKAVLEDFTSKDPDEGDAPSVWAAIRANHGGAIRLSYGDPPQDSVLVASRELVMHVYEDRDGDYSVSGQMGRMEKSFGPIFIGLDRGPAYERESNVTDKELMKVSTREAFTVAYGAARKLLDATLVSHERLSGARAGKIDLHDEFITPLLAAICRYWFGIPDDGAGPGTGYVEAGGWSWVPVAERKPRCPGDFIVPSRYIFYPDPVPAARCHGEAQGERLRKAVTTLFARMRAEGPKSTGQLTEAMFKAIPDDDLLARTVIGVMVGFLPPADGNLRSVLNGWIGDGSLWRVQRALTLDSRADPYDRAAAAIRIPLIEAMQRRPAPDMIWRTALRDHQLGEVVVEKGDRIIIGVASATMEALMEKEDRVLRGDVAARTAEDGVYPVFGGCRRSSNPPTHACPAYEFAMGTMMGMLTALLDQGRIEALPSPLMVRLTDLAGPIPRPATPPAERATASPVPRMSAEPVPGS